MMHFVMVAAVAGRVLTLEDALHTAALHQPQLKQAHANSDAARARQGEQLAPLLPQLSGTAGWTRQTANFVQRPTINTGSTTGQASSFDTVNSWNFGLTTSQTVFDFGATYYRWQSSKATTAATVQTENATRLSIALTVRVAYFTARAQKALVKVAAETLANQDKHLEQIAGFVKVGTRPEIDLAQARTDRANAQVQLITAENGYETAKAQLNQAIGVEAPTDYDVADETLAAIDVEDQQLEAQIGEAIKARPEVRSVLEQLRAQKLAINAIRGEYGPALGFAASVSDAGTDINNLAWNLSAGFTLSWSIFNGLQTWSQEKEAKATYNGLAAQEELVRQQVRLEVDQARLAVRAAKASLVAATEAQVNARERLRLAEGRYQAGVGNVIELGDAQVALTNAEAQRVQAEYNLSTARAQLMKALGRG